MKKILTLATCVFFLTFPVFAGKDLPEEHLLYTTSIKPALKEVSKFGGRVTLQLSDSVLVAHFPSGISPKKLSKNLTHASTEPPKDLDKASQSMVAAWNGKKNVFKANKKEKVRSWDDKKFDSLVFHSSIVPPPTSRYMMGRIAVGLFFVSGTTPGGRDFTISQDERLEISSQIIAAHDFLATVQPSANITFRYPAAYECGEIVAEAWDGKEGSSSQKAWMNVALSKLDYPPGNDGINKIVRQLSELPGVDYAYLAFITKYPLEHFAYVPKSVKPPPNPPPSNATLGNCLFIGPNYFTKGVYKTNFGGHNWPGQVNQLFAHETGHIFGAEDEYGECTKAPSGANNVPNGNCVNVNPGSIPCLMMHNTLSLCQYTQGQLGWPWYSPLSTVPNAITGGAISSTVYNNMLYLFYQCSSNNDVICQSWNGQTWQNNGVRVPNAQTGGAISSSVYNNTLYLFYQSSSSNDVLCQPLNGQTWGNSPGRVPNAQTGGAISSSVYNNTLYLFYKCNSNNDVLCQSWDGATWDSSPGRVPYAQTGGAISSTVYNNTLYILFKCSSNNDVLCQSWNGQTWGSGPGRIPNARTVGSINSCSNKQAFFAFFQAEMGNNIVCQSWNGQKWGNGHFMPGVYTHGAISSAFFNDQICSFWTANDASNAVYTVAFNAPKNFFQGKKLKKATQKKSKDDLAPKKSTQKETAKSVQGKTSSKPSPQSTKDEDKTPKKKTTTTSVESRERKTKILEN